MIYYTIYKGKELVGIGIFQGDVIPSFNSHFSYKKITKEKYEQINKKQILKNEDK